MTKPAKRGDIAAIVEMSRDFQIVSYGKCHIGLVTSVTRDGVVKAVQFAGDSVPTLLAHWQGEHGVLVASKTEVDAIRAMQTAGPFASLEEAQAALRSCQI